MGDVVESGESSSAVLLPHNGRMPIIVDRAVPFYRAIVLELERRRLQLGISMEEATDRAGLADRLYAKALYPDRPSGRQCRWETLQDLVDALFPGGYDVEIRPKAGQRLGAEDLRCKIKFAAAPKDSRSQRQLMRALGRLGGIARREAYKTMPREKRMAIAEKARKTRRKNRQMRAQLKQKQAKQPRPT